MSAELVKEYEEKLKAYTFDLLDGKQTKEQEAELSALCKRVGNAKLDLSFKREDVDAWLERNGKPKLFADEEKP